MWLLLLLLRLTHSEWLSAALVPPDAAWPVQPTGEFQNLGGVRDAAWCGEEVRAATATCVLLGNNNVLAGDCTLPGAVDGPPLFARFATIRRIACDGATTALLEDGAVRVVGGGTVTTLTAPAGSTDLACCGTEVAVTSGEGCLLLSQGRHCRADSRPTSVACGGGGWYVAWDDGLLQYVGATSYEVARWPEARVVKLLVTQGAVLAADAAAERVLRATLRCATCADGYASTGQRCAQSPPGSYGAQSCPPGTYNPTPGGSSALACLPCPPHTYADARGHVLCRACNRTHPLQSLDRTACRAACRPGEVELVEGACSRTSAPKACPSMHYADEGLCLPCPTGTASPEGSERCYVRCRPADGCPAAPDFATCRPYGVGPQVVTLQHVLEAGATCLADAAEGVYVGGAFGLVLYSSATTTAWRDWGPVRSLAWYGDSLALLLAEQVRLLGSGAASTIVDLPPPAAKGLASCARERLFLFDEGKGLWLLAEDGWGLWYAQEGITALACQARRLVFLAQRGAWELDAWTANATVTPLLAPQSALRMDGGIALWGGAPVAPVGHSIYTLGPLAAVLGDAAQEGQLDAAERLARLHWPFAVTADGGRLLFLERGLLHVRMAVRPEALACPCAQDWYQEQGGACLPCPEGTHAQPGATACTASCPSGYTLREGSCAACGGGGEDGCARALLPPAVPPAWYTTADVLAMRGPSDFLCVSQLAVACWRPLPLAAFGEGTLGMWYADDCASEGHQQWRLAWQATGEYTLWAPNGSVAHDGGVGQGASCALGQPAPEAPLVVAPCVYSGGACAADELPAMLLPGCHQPVCVPLRSIAGQRAVFSYDVALRLLYLPCPAPPPPWGEYVAGPDPTACYFACQYGVQRANVPAFYAEAVTRVVATEDNRFEFSQTPVAQVCQPCDAPQQACPLGRWRPPYAALCGAPCFLHPSLCLADGSDCTGACVKPQAAYFTGGGTNTADSCAWQCIQGFFRDRSRGTCSPCVATECSPGERFVGTAACFTGLEREQVCLPCPLYPAPSQLVPGARATTACQYACTQPTFFVPSPLPYAVLQGTLAPCVSCALKEGQSCPAGQRVSDQCQQQTCVTCGPAAVGVTPMPSNTTECLGLCSKGYGPQLQAPARTSTLRCVPCATADCSPPVTCAAGQYLDGRRCVPCPAHATCGTGWYRADCVSSAGLPPCIQCPAPASNLVSVPYTTGTASCPTDCPTNMAWRASSGRCLPCSAYNRMGLSYFAVWNATPAVRWWPRSMDALVASLPPRSGSGAPEPRAGVCWPCPPGTSTPVGAADLCVARTKAPIATTLAVFPAASALLQHKHACGSPYASPSSCECPKGVHMRRCLTPSAVL